MITPWPAYVQAPATALQQPVAIVRTVGEVSNPRALVTGDGATRLVYRRGERPPAVVLDFGKEVGGYPTFTVKAVKRETALRSIYSETLGGLYPDGDYGGRQRLTRVQVQPITGPGRLLSKQVEGGQRYVRISLTEPGRVDLTRAGIVFSGFRGTADRLRGYFLSSDRLLNRIWYAGVYTANLTQVQRTLPVLIDGGKRDRKIWSGDLLTAAPTVYYALDPSYVRGSLQTLAAAGAPLPGKCLPDGSGCEYYSAAYSMAFVLALRDYLRFTGDKSFVQSMLPTVFAELEYDSRRIGANGLYVTAPGTDANWNLEKISGETTYVSSTYYEALLAAADMAETFKLDASSLRTRAAAVRAAINASLWDEAKGVYDVSTTERDPIAQDANLSAILSGVAPAARTARILPTLDNALATPYGPRNVSDPAPTEFRPIVSPYMGGFQLQADFEAGRDAPALALMRQEWGWMLDHDPGGTFWEKIRVDGALRRSASAAHGWSTGATWALSRYVLGAAPVRAGWKTWAVRPHPGDVAWTEGSVPTRHGPLKLRWQRDAAGFHMTVSAPKRTSGTVAVPLIGQDRTVLRDGVAVTGRRDGDYLVLKSQSGTHLYSW